MNPFTKTNLRLGKLQSAGRPTAQPQPTSAEEEAILFGVAEEAPGLRPAAESGVSASERIEKPI